MVRVTGSDQILSTRMVSKITSSKILSQSLFCFSEPVNDSSAAVAVGVVIALLVVIAVTVVIVILLWRRG